MCICCKAYICNLLVDSDALTYFENFCRGQCHEIYDLWLFHQTVPFLEVIRFFILPVSISKWFQSPRGISLQAPSVSKVVSIFKGYKSVWGISLKGGINLHSQWGNIASRGINLKEYKSPRGMNLHGVSISILQGLSISTWDVVNYPV